MNHILIGNRQVDVVRRYDQRSGEWELMGEKLPKPLFSHGCNIVTLPDGRNGIMTAGGFEKEGIPSKHMYFMDLNNPLPKWIIYGPSVPLIEGTSLVYIGKELALLGTCHWIFEDQCCDRYSGLFYIFDWEKSEWEEQDTDFADEYAGNAVEVATHDLDKINGMKWSSLNWPNCILKDIGYSTNNTQIPIQSETVNVPKASTCSGECQKLTECKYWTFRKADKTCILINTPNLMETEMADVQSGEKNVCFYDF